MGYEVAQLAEALCYKPELSGSIPDGVIVIGVDSASNRNKNQVISWCGKGVVVLKATSA